MITLSLCMIVKNEEHNLFKCLSSALNHVDEIIVVDTGSEDNTVEIAKQFGAIINQFEWCDDFSAARNFAMSQGHGNWILILDADEEIIVKSGTLKEHLESEIERNPDIQACFFEWINPFNSGTTSVNTIRLFRNNLGIRYEGRFHESLVNISHPTHLNEVSILHYENTLELIKQKNIQRNIPFLERVRIEDGLDLTLLYTLATMYTSIQEIEKAQECFLEAFEILQPNLYEGHRPDRFGYVPSLLYALGAQAILGQDYEVAGLLCQRGIEWFPDFPPINYLSGIFLKNIGFPLGAVSYFEKCLSLGKSGDFAKIDPFENSYINQRPAYELGCIYTDLGRLKEALESFNFVLSFDNSLITVKEKIAIIEGLMNTSTESEEH